VNDIVDPVLKDLRDLLTGERRRDYGDPRDSFRRIAALWSVYLRKKVTPKDVAALMALYKLARLAHTPDHRDSWRDLAGYAVLGAVVQDE